MPRAPIWKAISDTLLAEIGEGHYRPGDRLPTEAQLAARFGVNRHTVRHALAGLIESGLLHARRGSGVFVASAPQTYPLSRRVRFHQNVAASGRTPSRKMLRLETRACDTREAEALNLPPGAMVHVVEGLSMVDDTALAVFRSVFPAARLPGLLAEMEKSGSVTVALIACGVADYTRASTRLTATQARATMALQLRVPEGAPILRSVAINHDPEGQPIEFGTTWFAGDRVELTVTPD